MFIKYGFTALLAWNIIVMFLYGVDKLLAKAHKRRISEAVLLLSAFLMGGIGGMFGMVLFNHKTSKMKFRIWIPIFVLIETAVLYCVFKHINI